MDLATATFDELADALEAGTVSSAELVRAYRARIEEIDVAGPALNAIRGLDPTADEQAAAADRARRSGRRGRLLGLPVVVKDSIDVAHMATTVGSLALAGWCPTADAAAVARLRRAGAVVLGKTNLTEWANFMADGMPGGFSAVGGQVRNPYDPDGGSPSGSSSGSAVAVAAGLAPLALGTETVGSILSPANACSVVAVKPTTGRVDRRGVVPLARSYDTVGPLAATVSGAAALLGALCAEGPVAPLDPGLVRGARLGVADGAAADGARPQWEEALAALGDAGATLIPVGLGGPSTSASVLVYEFRRDLDAYLAQLPAELPVHSLAELVEFNQAHAEAELVHGQAQLLRCLAVDPADPYTRGRYLAARQADRTLARRRIDGVVADHRLDALVFPAATSCVMGARAGYPSVAVPAGYHSDGRRPFGVTLLGLAGADFRLLDLAAGLEDLLGARRPPKWPMTRS